MEIRIPVKWLKKELWILIIIVALLVLNVVQFVHPFRGVQTEKEIHEIIINQTAFETCPAPQVTKDDIDKMFSDCLTKFNDLSKEQTKLLTPSKESTCETSLSTKRKAQVDDPIREHDCYTKQLGEVPAPKTGISFAVYKTIEVEKICGEDVYGYINIKLEDAYKKKTLLDKDIPFTYENKKVKCDEILTYDYDAYDPTQP